MHCFTSKKLFFILTILMFFQLAACGGGGTNSDSGDSADTANIESGGNGESSSPTASSCSPLSITAVAAPNAAFTVFTKQVNILGVAVIFAESSVTDAKALHAAGVIAQYLDNNSDGTIDSSAIESALRSSSPTPTMVMFNEPESAAESTFNNSGGYGHPLYGSEVHPEGTTARVFDAALEECLHLINDNGWKKAWPTTFGAYKGTSIANLTDAVAAAGYYTGNPTPDVDNRDYETQVDEFHYWNITTILGIQSVRRSEISYEWRLPTAAQIQAASPDSYALFTNSAYGMPTTAPNGNYCR